MMQHNPHHRILALTATPGGKPEVVQEIVDALHISHIEIRSETDPDLKKYLHTKHEQEHFVQMTEDICVLRDALSAMMVPLIKKIQGAGFLKNGNTQPTMLHPYRCQSTLGEMTKARAPQYAIGAVAQLGPLARAMGYLMEMSINMCYGFLKGIAEGADDSSGKKAIRKSDALKSLMAKFEEQAARGFSMHPKMDVLRTLLIDHFNQSSPDDADGGARASESRAMVFVSFRECVEEIVELLNKESPIIRAKPFIGQGKDKQGKKGYAQKEQLEVIEQFKAGKYNVLVSTSIGEEGLDIGEVDLI
ncbi:P-loop containing nucleoside triphosphate hydrolase protein, partial [Dichomitus squalens]